jgi:hypothetical protein
VTQPPLSDAMWDDAARDVEAEQADYLLAAAKTRVAGLWPFLAASRTPAEFQARLAHAHPDVRRQVESVSPGDDALASRVTAELVSDFRELHAARAPQRAADRVAAAVQAELRRLAADKDDDSDEDDSKPKKDDDGDDDPKNDGSKSKNDGEKSKDGPPPPPKKDDGPPAPPQEGPLPADGPDAGTPPPDAAMPAPGDQPPMPPMPAVPPAPDPQAAPAADPSMPQDDPTADPANCPVCGVPGHDGACGNPECQLFGQPFPTDPAEREDLRAQLAGNTAGDPPPPVSGLPVPLASARALRDRLTQVARLRQAMAANAVHVAHLPRPGQRVVLAADDVDPDAEGGPVGVRAGTAVVVESVDHGEDGGAWVVATAAGRRGIYLDPAKLAVFHPEAEGAARYEDVSTPPRPDWIQDAWDDDRQLDPGESPYADRAKPDGTELKPTKWIEDAYQSFPGRRASVTTTAGPYDSGNPYAVAGPGMPDTMGDPSQVQQARQMQQAPDLPGPELGFNQSRMPVPADGMGEGMAQPVPTPSTQTAFAALQVLQAQQALSAPPTPVQRMAAEAMAANPDLSPARAMALAQEASRRYPGVLGTPGGRG